MTTQKKYVVWFDEVDKDDIALVGGKGANLGEMTKAGIPVPNGFIVTSPAYYHFIETSGLRKKIKLLLAELDVSQSEKLEKASEKIKKLIIESPIPVEISRPILDAYLRLGSLFEEDPLVAVRSSATAEDLPDASFAGQQETFLNIRGDANVVVNVRKAWASLFTPRAIFYRVEKKFDHFKVGIAVPVQKMVQSEASGVIFTIDPVINDKKKLVIEAIYGLGELIVQGTVTPDHYELNKSNWKITQKNVANQDKMIARIGATTKIIPVPRNIRSHQKIKDAYIIALAQLGKKLERHYFFPQDIEWALEKGKLFITQTRPITTIQKPSVERKQTSDSVKTTELKLPILVTGDPASPGIGTGPVKIAHSAKEIKKIMRGDVLVAPQTNPDYVPAMRKVAAIVTEHGGRTSHAAIVSRELGIPAVVGAKDALKKLRNQLVVTVDGKEGRVYKGGLQKISNKYQYQINTNIQLKQIRTAESLKTATKVYVNLASPQRVGEIAKMNVDGVGLLRAEFMIADIGTHPKKLIKEGKQHIFVDTLSGHLKDFCEAFSPRPIVYRATDFKTNEYRNLKGGVQFEPVEANPMMGYRGAYRYVADPRVFHLELEALKRVRNKYGLKNLWLMIPYVHTPEEMLEVKRLVTASGLHRSGSFRLWMMVEIPSNVILIDKFLEVGIDGVSIGSNDLTQLTLGVDRDNSEVAQVFNERNDALGWSFERVIKSCHKYHATSSICGQAPSDYPELVEKLVQWGITSISVNPDVVDGVRDTIAHAEKKLVEKRSVF